jgi:asparagine synthase (glutamine-hydrolysing)
VCGIVGIYDLRVPCDPDVLDRFTDSLTHRGPDGRGTHIDGGLGLGHRRLAILDLSDAGRNPMSYGGADGRRYWITYNGEVYNFLELRTELVAKGHRFRSDTDTEVVLAAFAEWGPACLAKFNGMWAFAIWDSETRSLFLARDRFGVKPLYFHTAHGRVAFASEMKAFLTLPDFRPAINPRIAAKVAHDSQSYEGLDLDSIMAGVRRVPSGHYITVAANGDMKLEKWWDTTLHLPKTPVRYDEQVEGFRELFVDAVRLRLRADVPVGTCLSGGLDSSSVAAAMTRVVESDPGSPAHVRAAKDWRHAFIASFPGTLIDETAHATKVARHVGANAHVWSFDPKSAVSLIPETVWAMEEIYSGIAVPVWALYRELRRQGVVVSLDGHGSDELLGGYPWFLDWPMNEVNPRLFHEFHARLLPAILRNYDRCSMAHGIEVRMPFMDWRLVSYAMALPADAKIGGGYTKRVLRDAMNDLLPEDIRLRRQKIGFNSPMIELFNGDFAPTIRKIIAHPLWRESPYWDPKPFTDIVVSKTDAKSWTQDDFGLATRMWNPMNIVLWHMMFVEGQRP